MQQLNNSQSGGTSVSISIQGLSKNFGEIVALDDVSLDIPRGIVYGLLGPSGAGKTTLVRILSTILKPTRESATVDRHDVLKEPQTVRENIGILPEDTGLYDRLSAVETIRIFA